MKLDKIKFAKVIGYISDIVRRQTIDDTDIDVLDELIDIEVSLPKPTYANVEEINNLLCYMRTADSHGFIPAIQTYRSLTNASLKESKETIEKYRSDGKSDKINAMLDKIDTQIEYINNNESVEGFTLNSFNTIQLKFIKDFIESF